MSKIQFPKDKMPLYRKLFANEVKSEIEKWSQKKYKKDKYNTQEYLVQINKLYEELRTHQIKDADLISNKVLFRSLKRKHSLLTIRPYVILLAIFIVLAVVGLIIGFNI
ncbi:hypothetical protein [Mycoplasmopsis verecunda]|uniref:Uncharacterized protein n=1 Tax=Mycoplasmopsis verecunda TaxID=171291 RepID=A0A1T4KLH4_9BACT|nr:hypothetical protein [Mycoplasmopsis verecunda]WPB54282.1 hypothetical protein SAM46_02220 [Mycoplasmopsis verecunda]SJZ43228.1 hypothetical protein SAMN02745154_00099 [Mycoplasmopsis verecunda]